MNVLSLFSGIGGLDLGLERAGMTVVGQVEIDPWCRKVLAKHWPEVPRHDDVRTAADWWGGRAAPDLVAGGFPCQPVSLAGKGLAQADSRWLWPAFAGIVRHLRPRYVLVENVPGLLGRGLGDVLGDLAAVGYDAEWDCVPAAFVGAPHIRNRVWIVAYPAGIGRLGADHDQREHASPRRAGRPAADDMRVFGQAGSEPRILADPTDGQPQEPTRDDALYGQRAPEWRGSEQPARSGASGRAGGWDHPERADGNAAAVRRTSILADAPRDRRSAEGQRAPAGHADRSRQLRPGWPSHWELEPAVGRVADGIPNRLDRLRGLGNAVVPQVVEHIGRLIMSAGAA